MNMIPDIVEVSGLMGEINDREILMHLSTNTLVEIFELKDCSENGSIFNFSFINSAGIKEQLKIVVYKSDYNINENDAMIPIIEKIAEYYVRYCDWEDGNIRNNYKIQLN
jgi:hypothetical protein